MAVTNKDVKYVANLARLQLSGDETEQLKTDMNKILEYMEALNEVETEGVEPLEHVADPGGKFRKDEAGEPVPHGDALKNAPNADSDYFRVPRVIE